MAENDWDLYAVVRSCKSATNTATAGLSFNTSNTAPQNYLSCLSKLTFDEDDAAPFTFPSVVQPVTTDFHELEQACLPFMGCGTTAATTTTKANINTVCGLDISMSASSVSDLGGSIARQQQPFQFGDPQLKPRIFHDQHHQQQQQPQPQPRQFQIAQNNIGSCAVTLSNTSSQPTKSKKRKSQQKRLVCHVPPDKLSSDLWAWRKYGQKPIKGSPYPRNYYRCSSSKGCAARKQVERSTKDPELFIVTYTGEHTHPRPTHRNSLAGSTRPRLSSAPEKLDSQSSQLRGSNSVMNNTNSTSSPPMSASPATPATSSPPEDETESRDMEVEAVAANHILDDVDCFDDIDVDDDDDDDL